MDSYLMMLYVTLDQESALKNFFSQQGWAFLKPDLSVITDKLGPVMSLSTQTPVPAQATCTFPAETDIFSTVPENSVHIVTETDSLSAVPENTIHIQLETLDQPEVKSRSSRKRNTKSDQTKPSAKFPRLKLQLENKSGSAELPEKEQSEHIIQTENATYEPVFVDNVNRIIVKEEAVDSDYEPDNDDNDDVNDSESTDTCADESFKQTSADNDASGSRDVTEGDGEQDDETGAGTEERLTQKQRKILGKSRNKFQCGLCEKTFSSRTSLKHHTNIHAGILPNIGCQYCTKTFSSKHTCRRHELVVHCKVKNHHCELCDSQFGHSWQLASHKAARHGIGNKYECSCGKKFYNRKRFVVHQKHSCKNLKSSVKKEPINCPICNKLFKTPDCLKYHTKYVHNPDLVVYVCDQCGENFSRQYTLRRHKTRRHQPT